MRLTLLDRCMVYCGVATSLYFLFWKGDQTTAILFMILAGVMLAVVLTSSVYRIVSDGENKRITQLEELVDRKCRAMDMFYQGDVFVVRLKTVVEDVPVLEVYVIRADHEPTRDEVEEAFDIIIDPADEFTVYRAKQAILWGDQS